MTVCSRKIAAILHWQQYNLKVLLPYDSMMSFSITNSDETSSSGTVLNHFQILCVSISFIEQLFFSFSTNVLIYQLDFSVFWPILALCILESSDNLLLSLPLIVFRSFCVLCVFGCCERWLPWIRTIFTTKKQ